MTCFFAPNGSPLFIAIYISCISYILYILCFHYINYLHYIIVQAKPLHVSFRRNLDDQQSTLFKVLCVTVGIAPQTLFYCLCVQLPLFPFYEQWKICRVLFRGTSSPALYQYVRLHSRYVFLTTHFHKDYSCEGQ